MFSLDPKAFVGRLFIFLLGMDGVFLREKKTSRILILRKGGSSLAS